MEVDGSAHRRPQPSSAVVLHLLPNDIARGAQIYARSLLDAMDDDRQLLATLFDGPAAVLRPDIELRTRDGWLRRIGLQPRTVLRLRRLLRDASPTVVVAHGGEPLKYAVLAGVRSTPLVYWKIGTLGPEVDRPFRLRFHRWAAQRCDRVVAVSEAAAAEAVDRLGIDAQRVVVIPNGRDPASYQPSPHDHELPVVAFVGALASTKRPQAFVDVVRTLRNRGFDLDAVIAGTGPLRSDVAARAASVVRLLGSVEDIPSLLATVDLLVFPSEASGEGMPGVLIEAALAGVPVVATRVPGADEVVDDERTGLLVDVGDDAGLVDASAVLLADPERRRRMGNAARARALERFSIDAGVATWRQLLVELRARS